VCDEDDDGSAYRLVNRKSENIIILLNFSMSMICSFGAFFALYRFILGNKLDYRYGTL
jgi:hypothetical protein